MHSTRRLLPIVPYAFLALAGCGGNAAVPGVSSAPAAVEQTAGSRTADVAAVSSLAAASPALSSIADEASIPAVAPEAIVDAAPPNVAGTYNGSIQGRSQGELIARGPALFTISQHGASISGNVRFEVNHRPPVNRALSGTVAATPQGAILHFTFTYPDQSSPAGGWAKVDGASFVGRGWQVPDPPDEPYEQVLYWAKAE